jgi:hypothetical protein
MTIFVLMFLKFLDCEICVGENVNLTQILLLIFWGSKFCPSWMDSIGLRVPN